MKIQVITNFLENIAPLSLQESYDNAGLVTGHDDWECKGIITCLDATVEIVREAIEKNCNLIVAHHPIVFGGIKKLNGSNYIQQAVELAVKKDIAIYAIHTNLDNVLPGVNGMLANCLGLINTKVLQPKKGILKKLVTYIPIAQVEQVRTALFEAGAGHVGNYSECSFQSAGEGTFKGNDSTQPFVGRPGQRHLEPEQRLEVILTSWQESRVLRALFSAHPYEEVAYDLIGLDNPHLEIGAGLIGELPEPVEETAFLQKIKEAFRLKIIRHTPLRGKPVQKVALCGGAGSFLINRAVGAGADFYITGDIKYHEFFDANQKLIIADIGHYESEQYTIDALFDILREKFPNFAVLKTGLVTNPVQYFG